MVTKTFIILLLFIGTLALWMALIRSVSANHNIYLPYAGQTWLFKNIEADKEQVWCVDSRAAAYPNFVSQLRDVNDHYASLVGIQHRQVSINDPSCEVRHVMLPEFPCGSAAAACIYYANNPVTVHYQETLGYTSWASAHGHELGHGLLTLHERYVDSGGNIGCGGPDGYGATVMDCGPPHVRYPTTLDLERFCGLGEPAETFAACAPDPEPEPDPFVFDEDRPAWIAPNGNLFWLKYGVWEFNECTSWGGRKNNRLSLLTGREVYQPAGQSIFTSEDGWTKVPAC